MDLSGSHGHMHPGALKRRRRLQVLVLAVIAAMVLALGFYLGQRAAYSGMGLSPATYRAMEEALPQAESALAELQLELEVQQTRHTVDRQGLEMVRSEIAAQKEQIADLEEGLRFYRSLMAPGEIAQGLSLRQMELIPRDNPRHFGFRLVAQQEARKHTLLKGQLQVDIIGVREQEQVSYALADLSEDLDSGGIALQFRYFQSVEGELILPEGFVPQSVSLVATSTAPQVTEVRERFPWQVKERFTNAGQ